MAEKTRIELQKYFKSGTRTSGTQYVDLIDSFFGKADDISEISPDVLGNTLFVDPSAMPSEGEKGKINVPYPNPNDAQADAVAGDTIIIFPGSYNCFTLFKPGITYLALEGVTITNVGISQMGPPSLFEDWTFGEGVCRFLGKATLVDTVSFVNMQGNGISELTIECAKIDVDAGTPALIGGPSKSLSIKADEIDLHDTSLFVATASGGTPNQIDVQADKVIFNGTAPFVDAPDGVTTLRIRQLDRTIAGIMPLLNGSSSTGVIEVYGGVYRSTEGNMLVGTSNSKVLLDNVRYELTTTQANSMLNVVSPGVLQVRDSECIAVSAPPGNHCHDGNGEYIIEGILHSNLPKDVASVIKVGEFNEDSDLTV